MDTLRILSAILLIGAILVYFLRRREAREIVLSDSSYPEGGLRETLFGDVPLKQWASGGSDTPWSHFAKARRCLEAGNPQNAAAALEQVIDKPGLETRHYLQAWHVLRSLGHKPAPRQAYELLGVVVEVPVRQAQDIVAAYADHSARYLNHGGSVVVWDHPDKSLDHLVDRLIEVATDTVRQIGPWDGPRPGPPPKNQARLSFLTPGGICFGQGPLDVLGADPKGGAVVTAAMDLMIALMAKTEKTEG